MRILRYLGVLFLNLFFNFWGSVPAWILLVMHFVRGWPIIWFWLALAAWIAGVMIYMHVIGALVYLGNTDQPENKNKNPYSHKERNEK